MKLFLLCLSALFTCQLFTQSQTISLWGDNIPGQIVNENYVEEIRALDDGTVHHINKVVEPEILVYLPENKTSNGAIVIFPGGGYQTLSIQKEGYHFAEWFADNGMAAFVVKYRLPHDDIMVDKRLGPLQDAQQAMRMIRSRADQWGLDKTKIGIMGFSAGGHLGASISTMYDLPVYASELNFISARPDFSILVYPVISMQDEITHQGSQTNLLGPDPGQMDKQFFSMDNNIDEKTPPTFLVHASDDKVVSVENAIVYYQGLIDHGVETEMHIFQNGGHGFGMGRENTNDQWTKSLLTWLELIEIIN